MAQWLIAHTYAPIFFAEEVKHSDGIYKILLHVTEAPPQGSCGLCDIATDRVALLLKVLVDLLSIIRKLIGVTSGPFRGVMEHIIHA